MGIWARSWFAYGVLVVTGTVMLIYARVGKPIIDMGTGNGQFTGPFSPLLTRINSLIPILLSLIMLGVVVYVIVGGIQRERSVNRRRPKR